MNELKKKFSVSHNFINILLKYLQNLLKIVCIFFSFPNFSLKSLQTALEISSKLYYNFSNLFQKFNQNFPDTSSKYHRYFLKIFGNFFNFFQFVYDIKTFLNFLPKLISQIFWDFSTILPKFFLKRSLQFFRKCFLQFLKNSYKFSTFIKNILKLYL